MGALSRQNSTAKPAVPGARSGPGPSGHGRDGIAFLGRRHLRPFHAGFRALDGGLAGSESEPSTGARRAAGSGQIPIGHPGRPPATPWSGDVTIAVECPIARRDFVERGCALSMMPVLVSIAESLDERTRH